ncbi:MAG: hypothetical protein ACKOYM_09570, partial [Actinomycetes bacterium]
MLYRHRQSLRRSIGASLVVVTVVFTGVGSAAAASPTTDPAVGAKLGAAWLVARANASIPLKGFDGVADDWALTLDAGLALAAARVGGTTASAIWSAFSAQRDTALDGDNPGRIARGILLAVALGQDPRSVGSTPGADLIARLEATRITSGSDTGLFGSIDPTFDGAYRQAYALMAFRAAGVAPDPTAITWLINQQCADGSWMPYRSNLATPCALDLGLYVGPDSNSTGAAVEALAGAAGAAASVTSGLGWLDAQQNVDGGWSFFPDTTKTPPEGTSDPNSTAIVIQALVATGKLDDAAFNDRSAPPLALLLGFQLGCDRPAADVGALTYPGSANAANTFATAQGVPALAGVAFPL